MRGVVVSGRGEGKKFLSIPEYRIQILEKYGFMPYPGTLNLRVGKEVLEDIKKAGGDILEGFARNGREYGDVLCIPAKVLGENCLILLPEKTHHDDVLEVAAERNMRRKGGIHDGDCIDILFLPVIKKCRKRRTWAVPDVGKEVGKITVFYDRPGSRGRRDVCMDEKGEKGYGKTFPAVEVASILFSDEGDGALKMLMEFVEKETYGRMSPPRLIKYSVLQEWEVEVKTKDN